MTTNPRYELRAYEDTDACRLAAILTELTTRQKPTATRDALATRWAQRYPHHLAATNAKTIRNRIRKALSLLKIAGIAEPHDDGITIINVQRLTLSAQNLKIVQDHQGIAIRPGLWTRRPAAPAHLHHVQQLLERGRALQAIHE